MTAANPRGIAVGDTVVIVDPSTRHGFPTRVSEATITRVGRVYAYIGGLERYRERQFRIEDGGEQGDFCNGRMYTPDEWAEAQRRNAVLDELNRRGIRWDFPISRGAGRYSTDTLEWVVAALRLDPNDIEPVQKN